MRSLPLLAACLLAVAPFAAPAAAELQQPPRLVLTDDSAELDSALAAKSPPRDLSVRIAGITFPGKDAGSAQLLIVAEVRTAEGGSSKGEAGAGSSPLGPLASVSFVVEDGRGQSRLRSLRRGELRPLPDGSLVFSELVALPPGSYRVRLAVLRNARIGAAQSTVEVRTQTVGGLACGDLVVGEAGGDDLASSLSLDRRIRGDQLVASIAVAARPDAGPALRIEVAKEAAGPALVSAPAVAPDTGELVRLAQAQIDIRALPPGDYVVRAVSAASGNDGGGATSKFSRERAAAPASAAPGAGSPASARSNKAAPTPGALFRLEDVLEPAVLGPFLDELALRAPDRAKAAINQARTGHLAEAARSAAAADPEGASKPFLQGLLLFSQRQYQAASESFRETMRAAPDFFVGAFYIGACYGAGGRDPLAINAFQTSLVGLERYPIVYRLMAEAMTRLGQFDRAIETLDEALGKWPDNATVRTQSARAALDAKRYDRVFALVDAAMTRQPPPDLLFAGMQAVFEQVSQHPDAARDELADRMKRYRDAYGAAGGAQQALVAEWAAAVARKK
jgi:tetratricopeptide (TPR) repeat protein